MRIKINRLKFIILTISILSFQSASCQEKYEQLPENKTDKTKIELASKITKSYFENLKNENHYDFKNEAIKEFKDKMTPDIQKQTYEQIKQKFGDFKSITYSGTWIKKDNDEFQIIRFKGDFERSEESLEIRVVINGSNKISGLWITLWNDNLNNS